MNPWDELQSHLISQFRNASSIIKRLQVAVLQKQMESLQTILLSMKNTMEEFREIVSSLGKIYRDGKQLVIGSNKLTVKQLWQRIGVKPTLTGCLDGLILLHGMHNSESFLNVSLVSALSALAVKPRHVLKVSLVSKFSALAVKPGTNDLGALQQLLIDQPNIPKEEGQYIFEIIFAEEIC